MCGCPRAMCVCFFVCVSLPRLSRAEKDQPLPGPGTVMSPHRKCPGSSDNPCRLPAAHFLVISTDPVCPCLHVQKRTCVRPSSLQAEVIAADHVDPRPLKMTTPPPGLGYFSCPSYPRFSRRQLSCFSAAIRTSYYVPDIAVTPRLGLPAECWMRQLLLRPGRSLHRRP